MTLSRSNPHAKPRWFALLVLVCIGLAFAASAVSALTTQNPPSLPFVSDEGLADDQPGQKDLSAHAVNFNPATGELWVAWKWDVLKLSGGNTGDACALFDTDTDGKINFAVCVTIGGDPAAQLTNSPRIYTCGDAKVDRCTSPATLVPSPGSYATACSVNQAGLDRTDPFHAGQLDTTALCHIALSEVGATTAALVNTCSYPSQQPNSDPSDCVLIPRDAFLVITKVATPSTQGTFPFHIDGNATAAFTAAGSQTSSQIAISSNAAHTLKEAIPANWAITGTPTCTGTSGPGSSNGSFNGTDTITGIDASPDNVVTCTFNDQLQTGSILVTKVDGASVLLAGAGFTIDPDPTTVSTADDVLMTEYADGVFCTDNLAFASYTVTETTVPPGYNGAAATTFAVSTVTACADRIDANGLPVGASDIEFSNSPAPGTVTVQKNDDEDPGVGLGGVGFTLYVDVAPVGTFDAADTTVAAAEVNTDTTGLATFSNIAPGFYCAVETTPLAGYAAADPNWLCGELVIGANVTLALGTLVNEQEHTIIVLVCHDATDLLAPSDVTINPGAGLPDETTLTSLAAGALSAAQQKAFCDLGGASWSGLVHGDTDLSVDVGSDAH